MDNQSVIFVPAPLFNIAADKDVGRILSQLDKNDPAVLASFFYHPTQEFKYLYKMKTPEGKEFYAHEPDSYLKRLINGFKERGYKFVSVYDLIGFLPAERFTGLSAGKGKVMLSGAGSFNQAKPWLQDWREGAGAQILTGDFNGDEKLDLAVSRQFAGGETPIDLAVSAMNRKNGP